MRIVIITPSTDDADPLSLDIPSDTTISTLKESVQAESGIPISSQHIWHNGKLLDDDTKTMEQLQIADNDMLSVHIRETTMSRGGPASQSAGQMSYQQVREGRDRETQRLQILGNPQLRQELENRRPELAAALDDPERFAQVWGQLQSQERDDQMRRQQMIAELNADPFNVENQQRIQEMIREERVQENLQNAIEHNPEVFGRVHMLYIDVEVNGHRVKAFVDSGAQATIMSPSCAETCGIMRLVDTRFAGMARGVGTAAILGRVHSAQIRIGNLFLPCSFTVMEGKDVDLLLGLDMLRRHQACIDLAKEKLVIQGVEVPFLGEADIPKQIEEERAEEPVVPGPGGASIGAKSGAIMAPGQAQQPEASGSTPSAPNTTSTQPPAASFPPEDIDKLVSLGFSREEACNALVACGGNVEYAAGLLFQN